VEQQEEEANEEKSLFSRFRSYFFEKLTFTFLFDLNVQQQQQQQQANQQNTKRKFVPRVFAFLIGWRTTTTTKQDVWKMLLFVIETEHFSGMEKPTFVWLF